MYSKELIAEVKRVFPNNQKMHEMAYNGDAFLGRYLDDASDTNIHIDIILSADTLEELKKLANKQKEILTVYKMWIKEDPRPKRY